MRTFFYILITAFIAGCSAWNSSGLENTPFEPRGVSYIEILKEIPIPPGRTRVFFQYGQINSQFDHYHPNCNIEVRKLDHKSIQIVSPGNYQIIKTQTFFEHVVHIRSPIVLASSDDSLLTWFHTDITDIYRSYHFYLSGNDKNILRLTCRGALESANTAKLPGKAEILESLGNLITIGF